MQQVKHARLAIRNNDYGFFQNFPDNIVKKIAIDYLSVPEINKLAKIIPRLRISDDNKFWENVFIKRYSQEEFEKYSNLSISSKRVVLLAYGVLKDIMYYLKSSRGTLSYSIYYEKRMILFDIDFNEKQIIIDSEYVSRDLGESLVQHFLQDEINPEIGVDLVESQNGNQLIIEYQKADEEIEKVILIFVSNLLENGWRTNMLPPDIDHPEPYKQDGFLVNCNICNRPAQYRCCNSGLYCGAKCQEKDWEKHYINH